MTLLLSAVQVNAKTIYPEQARAENRNCFQAHLHEAIKTNRERRDLYAELSNGKSRHLTRMLIIAEKLGLIMAKYFDAKALEFQEQGMTIVCDELLSPRSVPEFVAMTPPVGEVPEKFISVDGKKLRRQLKKARQEKGVVEVARITEEVLNNLAVRPSFNCLIRNDLTTILKTARLLERHENQALENAVDGDVRKLSLALLDRVIAILPMVDNLDRDAFPLQKMGIAMICQDFPEARPRASYSLGSSSDL
jgi:hypothetical protein